jgi:hypothetical protein
MSALDNESGLVISHAAEGPQHSGDLIYVIKVICNFEI